MEQADFANRTKRRSRYADFRIFVSLAEEWFPEFGADDIRHKFFSTFYHFYVVVGGRDGAIDNRVVEIFYGGKPIDQITQMSYRLPDGTPLPFPRPERKLAVEAGACLRYERTERGTVLCFLEPARSEGFSQREELIVLAHITSPQVLTGKPILKRHWKAFLSYSETSSVDGDPQISDQIRIAWLLFTRPLIVEGKVQERRILSTVKWMAQWIVTVGLSGALLALVAALQHKCP